MTIDKIKEVISIYNEFIPRHLNEAFSNLKQEMQLTHCLEMLPKMLGYLEEKRVEKVFRHLGFIQGVLWAYGCFTIDELKNHNRPTVKKEEI